MFIIIDKKSKSRASTPNFLSTYYQCSEGYPLDNARDCVISKSSGGLWQNANCSTVFQYSCQKEREFVCVCVRERERLCFAVLINAEISHTYMC